MTGRALTHRCPGRCGRTGLPPRILACTGCLARVPAPLRAALTADTSWEPATSRAAQDVRDWLLEHPSPTDADAAIAGWCEHCTAELLWLTTAAGKRMPVDARPDAERGNVVRDGRHAGVLGAGPAAAARAAGRALWLHHAASCPHASRWNTGATRAGRRRAPARR